MATTMSGQVIPVLIPSDFRMVSMLDAAYFEEDLPPYTPGQRRDADTMSIRSAAPSYRSEPPAYGDVEPYRRSTFYADASFFDDSSDDTVMTEIEIHQTHEHVEEEEEEEDEPLTPTQSRIDTASQQQSSLLYPDEPLSPRRAPPPPPVPTTPRNQSFSLLDVEAVDDVQDLPQSPTQEQSYRGIEPRGLPRLSWAPGFRPLDAFSAANYNLANLPTVSRNPIRRQYENVARRRVQNQDSAISNLLAVNSPLIDYPPEDLPELTREESPRTSREITPTPPSPRTPIHAAIAERTAEYTQTPLSPTSSANPMVLRPQEDPELVGEYAAKQARQQREYREMMSKDQAHAIKLESAGWDFMLSQSRDWEERQTSWAMFRQTRIRKQERRAARSAFAQGPSRWFWRQVT